MLALSWLGLLRAEGGQSSGQVQPPQAATLAQERTRVRSVIEAAQSRDFFALLGVSEWSARGGAAALDALLEARRSELAGLRARPPRAYAGSRVGCRGARRRGSDVGGHRKLGNATLLHSGRVGRDVREPVAKLTMTSDPPHPPTQALGRPRPPQGTNAWWPAAAVSLVLPMLGLLLIRDGKDRRRLAWGTFAMLVGMLGALHLLHALAGTSTSSAGVGENVVGTALRALEYLVLFTSRGARNAPNP